MIKQVNLSANNIYSKKQSFGSTVVVKDYYDSLSKDSQLKIKQVVLNLNSLFPLNAVYIQKSHDNNSFSYKVQQAHPMTLLVHPNVMPHMLKYFKTAEELLNYVRLSVMMDIGQKRLLGIKAPSVEGEITNIEDKKAGTILATMMNVINKFNMEQQKKNPGS